MELRIPSTSTNNFNYFFLTNTDNYFVMSLTVQVADESHYVYAETICNMMAEAAKIRGTGIAKRKAEYLIQKMKEGKAVIALDTTLPVGFCYIESWENHKYVANSGLIVHPDYRKFGLAKDIKKAVFELSKKKFPNAVLFGITTSMAVMKINSDLGYKPVTFSELTTDNEFWSGCQSCPNYDILQRTEKSMCLCTGMRCDLSKIGLSNDAGKKKSWESFKQFIQKRKAKKAEKLNLKNNEQ
tara:strand:+ start:27083 stop:27805 length:723 start_codon:yes stop_codon:yes gene_type:complete